MSIRATVWAFEQDLPTNAKFVLVKLADNANDDGVCWPSMQYVASHTGMSRRSVIDQIDLLASKGLIRIEHRTKNGAPTSNLYFLNLPVGVVKQVHQVVKDVHQGSETGSLGVVKQVHTNLKSESSIEPPSIGPAKAGTTKRLTALELLKEMEAKSKLDPHTADTSVLFSGIGRMQH